MNDNEPTEASSPVASDGGKAPYATPNLDVHGSVEEMTQIKLQPGPSGEVFISDRAAKQDFDSVDTQDVLNRLVVLPVESWSYKAEGGDVRHIGPMAQDFAKAFGLGSSDKTIAMVDANGVAIAAVQALHSMILQRDEQIQQLQNELRSIKSRLGN
jgi:hypothetical protein